MFEADVRLILITGFKAGYRGHNYYERKLTGCVG